LSRALRRFVIDSAPVTSDALASPPVRAPSGARSRRRFRALVRLLDARVRARFGAQLAKLFAALVFVAYAVILLFAGRGHRAVAVVESAVATLSWFAAGIIALSAAGPVDEDDAAVAALARQRGWGPRALAWATFWAVARRVAAVVGVPALVLALEALALSVRGGAMASRVFFVLGVVIYVAVLSVAIAVLARLATSLSPTRGRWLVVFLVVLPEALRSVFPTLPSLPQLLGALLDQIVAIGGRG
jgi:hypothetical protein